MNQRAGRTLKVPPQKANKKKKEAASLPVIKCTCGKEILLVPNVKVMNEAIETHVLEHIKDIKSPKEAEVEAERVRDDLIIKVLEKASEP
jgi:hypothetical protein